MKRKNGLEEIKRKRGLKAALAKHLHLTRQAVSDWEKVPIAHLIKVEKFTGIPRERLRPDIFERRRA